MQLSISNLAWPPEATPSVLRRLSALGVRGIEVAPTRIASWEVLDVKCLRAYRRQVEDAGLVISSLQAILFGQPNAALLGDEARFEVMCRHINRVADIAEILGANALVFGAPRNRQLEGLARNEAHRLGQERFRLLGEMLAGRPVTIGIEPVPAFYGGEFLTSAHDVIEMVKEVDLSTVQVHLDTGCVKLNGDSISGAIRCAAEYLCHFHASEPDLDDFSAPTADHAAAAQALKLSGYTKWIAIEMREPREASLELLERSVKWVLHAYFEASTP